MSIEKCIKGCYSKSVVANGNIEYLTINADILVLPHEYVDKYEKYWIWLH